jgi:hypothetical protein
MKVEEPWFNVKVEESELDIEFEELPSYSSATKPEGNPNHRPVVTIHPLKSKDGVLVRVQPPDQPSDSAIGHVPCDIVLVIDVSDSMNLDAPAPANNKENATKEYSGLNGK